MLFYTGCRISEDRKIQRIGAALSDDLDHWEKIGALLEVDPRYYETFDSSRWHDQSFRDPWVYEDPAQRGWRMLFTARDHDANARGAGVIGQAFSDDLFTWKVQPPLVRAGYYGEMEVPQLFYLDGWWYCLFSNSSRHRDPTYLATGRCGACTGTHYVRAPSADGPFELVEEHFFAGDAAGHLYGGRAIVNPDGDLVLLAFLNHRSDGSFVGEISNPMRMWTTSEGYLRVDAIQYGVPPR
jgi:beta-fructofuranosidase